MFCFRLVASTSSTSHYIPVLLPRRYRHLVTTLASFYPLQLNVNAPNLDSFLSSKRSASHSDGNQPIHTLERRSFDFRRCYGSVITSEGSKLVASAKGHLSHELMRLSFTWAYLCATVRRTWLQAAWPNANELNIFQALFHPAGPTPTFACWQCSPSLGCCCAA